MKGKGMGSKQASTNPAERRIKTTGTVVRRPVFKPVGPNLRGK